MQSFVHLRVHSEYSFVDGLVRVKNLVKKCTQETMPAVALTDQTNLCALIKFYKAALSMGVKPIIGADIWVSDRSRIVKPWRMTLLAQNEKGYGRLRELLSLAYQNHQSEGLACIEQDWLSCDNQGLILLSGGLEGDIGQALLAGHSDEARRLLLQWSQWFSGRFYVELQRLGRDQDERYMNLVVPLAEALNCPLVATNDVRFMQADDFEAHEARVCIGESTTLNDPRRKRHYTEQQYFKTTEQMAALFQDIPSAIENTRMIAERCSVQLTLGDYYFPDYPIPEGLSLDAYFRQVSIEGLQARLDKLIHKNYFQKKSNLLKSCDAKDIHKLYFDRLIFELDIIIQMGFASYFLIVMDFIRWAKQQYIPVGPGRGSGAGSLVAYALQITDLDPLEYDLLFERFLNPERVSMPDFDIDFCMDHRDRVIDYVAERYGRGAVSQIVTFGTMAAKAVVRDVARVQGKSYSLADKLSKLIPLDLGMTLEKARDSESALQEFLEKDEEAQEIWEMALKLEGITRGAGKHAGGVVIAPTRLTDFTAIFCDEDGANLVTQFDKNDVEEAGLVKFDFLGLRTLTIIDRAVKAINQDNQLKKISDININDIPLQDERAFQLLKQAKTTAVFQLESRGMKDLVKRLQPDCIEDMIALVALFRPGPLQSGMVDDFINRKRGNSQLAYPHPNYQHDDLIPVLKPTYGIILYQEQVMKIAQILGGYTLGSADLLRRAMGKKKPEEMAKQRDIFMQGAIARGVDSDLAANIFDLMEKFAGYGFNKSHSAAYALLSYQTLWLKAHYSAHFMASVLTSDMQHTDKIVVLLEDCRALGLEVVLPDVNEGNYGFSVNAKGHVVYGLGAVKGVGEGPVEALVLARERGGRFRDLFDFCRRVDKAKFSKRVLESLIRCGAFDHIGPNRATLFACIEPALKQADQRTKNTQNGIVDLFGEDLIDAELNPYQHAPQLPEWFFQERLKGEKETLGLYISGHPFAKYECELRFITKCAIKFLKPSKKLQSVAGLLSSLRLKKSRRGDTLAFLTLEDGTGRLEVVVFGELFEKNCSWLRVDQVMLVEGEISEDTFSGILKLRAKSITSLQQVRSQHAQAIEIEIDDKDVNLKNVQASKAVFVKTSEKSCPIVIHYFMRNARVSLRLGQSYRASLDESCLQALKNIWGEDKVKICYA